MAKFSKKSTIFPASLLLIAFAGCAAGHGVSAPVLQDGQLTFENPTQAFDTLASAVKADNRDQLSAIFGPGSADMINSGDQVADREAVGNFAKALNEKAEIVQTKNLNPAKRDQDLAFLMVGKASWPFPIALIKENSRWRFDTEVGKQEIISRRVGKNELNVLALCGDYVAAQREYQILSSEGKIVPGSKTPEFAGKFYSSPGKKDGLFWPQAPGEPRSPIGPLVAQASLEGYAAGKSAAPAPFHGYYFRILTSQGKNARGGAMNFVEKGKMTRGFALLAYPAEWDNSGAMTFLVGPDGIIYEKNLGAKTAELAQKITRFDPDPSWDPTFVK